MHFNWNHLKWQTTHVLLAYCVLWFFPLVGKTFHRKPFDWVMFSFICIPCFFFLFFVLFAPHFNLSVINYYKEIHIFEKKRGKNLESITRSSFIYLRTEILKTPPVRCNSRPRDPCVFKWPGLSDYHFSSFFLIPGSFVKF